MALSDYTTGPEISVDDGGQRLFKIATFEQCACTDWTAGNGAQHFKVSTRLTQLRDACAVTISYTWSEFDRQDYWFGHLAGQATASISLTLGAEWSKPNFMNRLVELSTKYGGCWIDQICMPQKTKDIRQTLEAIPTIFRTLPMIMLLPGSLCKCLPEAWRACEETREKKGSLERKLEDLRRSALKGMSRIFRTKTVKMDDLEVRLANLNKVIDQDLTLLTLAAGGSRCLASNGLSSYFE